MNDDIEARAKRVKAAMMGVAAERKPKRDATNSIQDITVAGDGNIIGNVVNIHPQKPARPRVVVQPGDGVISSAQAAELRNLVAEIVDLEGKLKRDPATYQKIFASLNRAMKVGGFREIPIERFEVAKKYLQKWRARLNAAPSAPVKDGSNWRKGRYAYIKVNAKDPEDAAALQAHLQRKYRVTSLTDLANDELDAVYRYVAGRRQRRK